LLDRSRVVVLAICGFLWARALPGVGRLGVDDPGWLRSRSTSHGFSSNRGRHRASRPAFSTSSAIRAPIVGGKP